MESGHKLIYKTGEEYEKTELRTGKMMTRCVCVIMGSREDGVLQL